MTTIEIFENVSLKAPLEQRRFFDFFNNSVDEIEALYHYEYSAINDLTNERSYQKLSDGEKAEKIRLERNRAKTQATKEIVEEIPDSNKKHESDISGDISDVDTSYILRQFG